jgi:uncharacterized membrane protein
MRQSTGRAQKRYSTLSLMSGLVKVMAVVLALGMAYLIFRPAFAGGRFGGVGAEEVWMIALMWIISGLLGAIVLWAFAELMMAAAEVMTNTERSAALLEQWSSAQRQSGGQPGAT